MNAMQICQFLWITFLVIWVIWGLRTKPVQSREGVSSRLSYALLTVAAAFTMFAGNVPREWLRIRFVPANTPIQVLGIAVTAMGIAFAIWARIYLGGNWSSSVTVKVEHELIRSGPYH